MYDLICVKIAWLIGIDKLEIHEPNHEITPAKSSKNPFQTHIISLDTYEKKVETQMIKIMRSIQMSIESIQKMLEEKNTESQLSLKWKYAAYTMDRFFLYILIVYFVFTFSLLILVHKNFYNYN